MEKSHVSMEQQVCLVCGQKFDTGAILLDKRLRQSMYRHTVTGWGLCPSDTAKRDAGYVAMVGVRNTGSGSDRLKPEEADRSGTVAHIKREAFVKVFGSDPPPDGMCFADAEVIERLAAMQMGAQA